MATADSAGRGPGAMARHIASVAARLFATRGYDATSVRTIVEEAGVTKPTLYYHFGSKEGLAQALLTVPMTELVAANRAILEAVSDPVEALARIIEAHFAFCREDPDRARFLFALLFGPLGAGLEDEMKRFGDTFVGLITEAVRHLADAGLIASGRVADATRACRGLLVIATLDFLYRGDPLEPGLGRRLVDDLLRGFTMDSRSTSV
ncbi:MAG: TetR/AcrR family transcriptional regulator [Planctomycetaceae bacterium]|nr:TetR/AcrR family transcriptional regulator [Planctomycetaceae bacterium]